MGVLIKNLTTHLTSKGINPHQYRNMFGLPTDYPMVAPKYSKIRAEISMKIGLGRYSDKNAEKP